MDRYSHIHTPKTKVYILLRELNIEFVLNKQKKTNKTFLLNFKILF